MEAKYWILGIVAVVAIAILICVGVYIGTQNSIIGKENTVDQKMGNIEACLQQRNDLIPRVVEVAKFSLKSQERIIFNYTKLREGYDKAIEEGDLDQMVKLEEEYKAFRSDLRSQVDVQVEAVPNIDLTQLTELNSMLDSTERVIRTARIDYNEAVRDYNTGIEQWPGSIWAQGWGFYPKQMFKSVPGAENPPEIGLL